MGTMDLIMGTVELPEATITELTKNSEYAARVLRTLRDRMETAHGEKNRVSVADVFTVINAEIDAFEAGANPDTWRKADGRAEVPTERPARPARAVKDVPQA
jgi:hypothetical protein